MSHDRLMSGHRRTLRSAGIVLACLTYVGVSGYFLVRHMLGDSHSHEIAYFFTWDMFSGYTTENAKRTVVGETVDGKYVQLLPAADHRFRWDADRDITRLDLLLREEHIRPATRQAVRRYNSHNDNAIRRVLVVEQFWPIKFNLPDDLYRRTYGVEHPHRRYWRVLARWNVTDDGELVVAREADL